jgi:hypothetical protein
MPLKRNNLLTDRSVTKPLKILVAPPFFRHEVKEIVSSPKSVLPEDFGNKVIIAIKFHPATKFQSRLKFQCRKKAPWLKTETEPMEVLADRYDATFTNNSISAIDFLLRGKPVLFHPLCYGRGFPSADYRFTLPEIKYFIYLNNIYSKKKNFYRIFFKYFNKRII